MLTPDNEINNREKNWVNNIFFFFLTDYEAVCLTGADFRWETKFQVTQRADSEMKNLTCWYWTVAAVAQPEVVWILFAQSYFFLRW